MPLNDEQLNILKQPFGKLIKQDEITKEKISALVKDSKSLITVGDASTEKIISYGVMPNLSIIDGVERRIKRTESKISELKNLFENSTCNFKQYHCKNPKVTITKEPYNKIKKILRNRELPIVFINGEEDMLALPVFALASLGSVVFSVSGIDILIVLWIFLLMMFVALNMTAHLISN